MVETYNHICSMFGFKTPVIKTNRSIIRIEMIIANGYNKNMALDYVVQCFGSSVVLFCFFFFIRKIQIPSTT